MPPHKINFAFFGAVGISLFYHEISIFKVTETIVSRETNAIAVRVPQRSERRQIEKTLVFWKLSRQKRAAHNKANVEQRIWNSAIQSLFLLYVTCEPWTVNRKAPKYPTEN